MQLILAQETFGSGSEITHAFHPLRGQRFAVLKVQRLSGIPTLSMLHAELGSFAVPQEWTDWNAPAEAAELSLIADASGLIMLVELVDSLKSGSKGD